MSSLSEFQDEVFLRQLDFFDPLSFPGSVAIVGLGAIGSSALIALVKMGIKEFTLYDFDLIEPHNRPNQLYFYEQTGTPKAEAAAEVAAKYAPEGDVICVPRVERFTKDTRITDRLVVVAVDSRDARMDIWEALKESDNVRHLIDARMGGESLRVYNIPMHDEKAKERYVESFEGEVSPLPCTGQSIIYNLFAISGFIGSSVRKHIVGETSRIDDVGKRIGQGRGGSIARTDEQVEVTCRMPAGRITNAELLLGIIASHRDPSVVEIVALKGWQQGNNPRTHLLRRSAADAVAVAGKRALDVLLLKLHLQIVLLSLQLLDAGKRLLKRPGLARRRPPPPSLAEPRLERFVALAQQVVQVTAVHAPPPGQLRLVLRQLDVGVQPRPGRRRDRFPLVAKPHQ